MATPVFWCFCDRHPLAAGQGCERCDTATTVNIMTWKKIHPGEFAPRWLESGDFLAFRLYCQLRSYGKGMGKTAAEIRTAMADPKPEVRSVEAVLRQMAAQKGSGVLCEDHRWHLERSRGRGR